MRDIYHSDNVSVVVDNNVLIDLFEIRCLNLLFEIFEVVIIPKIIYDAELDEMIKKELKDYKFHLGVISTTIGLETYALLVNEVTFKRLSRYDRFAIAIAKENLYYCNSNDKPVRNACEKLQVKYTGILGVLGRAFFRGSINLKQLNSYVERLASEDTSCYLDLKLIEQFKVEIRQDEGDQT